MFYWVLPGFTGFWPLGLKALAAGETRGGFGADFIGGAEEKRNE